MKKAGYATNPQYPKLLIRIIEENEFYLLDKITEREIKGKLPNEGPVASKLYLKKYRVNKRLCVDLPEGVDLVRLSQELAVKAKMLYKYNDITPSKRLATGERIFIQPKRSSSKTSYHRVEKGETLWRVSQRHGIKLKSLYKRNGIPYGSEVAVGERIKLKGVAQYPPKLRSANEPYGKPKAEQEQERVKDVDEKAIPQKAEEAKAEPVPIAGLFHTVNQGETLYSISRIYGVSVESIKKLNDLITNDIKVGSRIRIK